MSSNHTELNERRGRLQKSLAAVSGGDNEQVSSSQNQSPIDGVRRTNQKYRSTKSPCCWLDVLRLRYCIIFTTHTTTHNKALTFELRLSLCCLMWLWQPHGRQPMMCACRAPVRIWVSPTMASSPTTLSTIGMKWANNIFLLRILSFFICRHRCLFPQLSHPSVAHPLNSPQSLLVSVR